ncbi:MAG: hypothetical protein ACI4F1_14510 [Bariatricus sp.]
MEELKYSAAFLRKASDCKTVEEVLKLAESEKVAMDLKSASSLLNKLQFQFEELSEDMLKMVAGGMRTDIPENSGSGNSESEENNTNTNSGTPQSSGGG